MESRKCKYLQPRLLASNIHLEIICQKGLSAQEIRLWLSDRVISLAHNECDPIA